MNSLLCICWECEGGIISQAMKLSCALESASRTVVFVLLPYDRSFVNSMFCLSFENQTPLPSVLRGGGEESIRIWRSRMLQLMAGVWWLRKEGRREGQKKKMGEEMSSFFSSLICDHIVREHSIPIHNLSLAWHRRVGIQLESWKLSHSSLQDLSIIWSSMTMMSFELTLKEDCEDTKWDKIVCSHKLVILQIQAIQMTFVHSSRWCEWLMIYCSTIMSLFQTEGEDFDDPSSTTHKQQGEKARESFFLSFHQWCMKIKAYYGIRTIGHPTIWMDELVPNNKHDRVLCC